MTLKKIQQQGTVFSLPFSSWEESLQQLMNGSGMLENIPTDQTILIKPNLVENLQPPVTVPVQLIAALVDYLQRHTSNPIIIGEGTGSKQYDTWHPFETLGYIRLAEEKGIQLVDLNEEPSRKRELVQCKRWPELYLPEMCYNCFLLSVPMLKVHTLAGVTLTMKNMMGLLPPAHYCGGTWKKSAFHHRIQESVADLNRYRTPDFTLLDATIGMAESHLWGRTCDPPVNILAAGFDPVSMDSYGAWLLGKEWREIGHISGVDGELGQAEPLEILNV